MEPVLISSVDYDQSGRFARKIAETNVVEEMRIPAQDEGQLGAANHQLAWDEMGLNKARHWEVLPVIRILQNPVQGAAGLQDYERQSQEGGPGPHEPATN